MYCVFYKDKSGYSLPMTDDVKHYEIAGRFLVFQTKHLAEAKMREMEKALNDYLHPKIEYKTIKTGFFRKEVVKIPPEKIPDWHIQTVKQKLASMHVKSVKII